MKITIKSICGKIINLEDVKLDTTINKLLITCSRELNIRKEKIKLVYAGICIDRTPEKTIAEIKIPDNAIIHLAGNKYIQGENNQINSLGNYLGIQNDEIITLRRQLEDARMKIEFLSSSYE